MATSTALVPTQLDLFEDLKRNKQPRVRIATASGIAVTSAGGRIQITQQTMTALTVEEVYNG